MGWAISPRGGTWSVTAPAAVMCPRVWVVALRNQAEPSGAPSMSVGPLIDGSLKRSTTPAGVILPI